MRQAGRLGLLLATVCLAIAGEVRVDASCVWEDKDGYTPVQIRAEALIAPLDVHLEVRMGQARATATLRAEPGITARTTVLLPCNPSYGSPEVIWSAGSDRGSESVSVTVEHMGMDVLALDPREELPVPAWRKLVEDKLPNTSRSGRSHHSSSGERVRRLAADLLPDRWQGWPAWLTLVTTPAGEAALDPAQREAIATWTRMGGALFVSDPASVPAWRKHGARVEVLADGDATALIQRLTAVQAIDGTPTDHPVPGTSELPTAWFLTLAITFAVVAGPLNLWWTIRRRQPWLLLVTTPLISLGTCLLLIAIALASDGISRKRTAMQVAVIDQDAQRTSVFHAVTWFCGIAPGSFALDPEDRLQPMDEADYGNGWRRDRPELILDWRRGQDAVGGWIPARINRQLACTQARPERRRLTIVRSGNAWRIGNGLDVAIQELHWSDGAGLQWQVNDLPAGQEKVMTPAQRAALAPNTHRFGLDARIALIGVGQEPGSWVARLGAPLHPVPGPSAEDLEPVETWAVGVIAPSAPSATSPGAF